MAFLAACGSKKEEKVNIGLTQIVQHPSLDQIRKGILDTLESNGYVDGENVVITSYSIHYTKLYDSR